MSTTGDPTGSGSTTLRPSASDPTGLRAFGRTDLSVSALCLGAMNFGDPTDDAESIRIVDAALDGGINFIDTADVYSGGNSERILGEAFATERPARRDRARDEGGDAAREG